MKQLFLKSNLLHIRLKEGEYLVENAIDIFYDDRADKMVLKHGGKFYSSISESWEWPYGVELIELPDGGRDMSGPPYPIVDFKTVARLLPEEKKDLFDQALDKVTPEIKQQVDKEIDRINSAHSFTESAYKEGEASEKLDNDYNRGFEDAKIQAARIISDNYQKCITTSQCLIMGLKPVSAPSESQEEKYDEVRQQYLKHRGRIWTKEEEVLKWIIENYTLITRNP